MDGILCYSANKCSTSQLTVQTRFTQDSMRVLLAKIGFEAGAKEKCASTSAIRWHPWCKSVFCRWVLCTLCMLWFQAMRSAFFCQTQSDSMAEQSCYTVNKVIKVLSLNYAKCMQMGFIEWTTISHKSFVVWCECQRCLISSASCMHVREKSTIIRWSSPMRCKRTDVYFDITCCHWTTFNVIKAFIAYLHSN